MGCVKSKNSREVEEPSYVERSFDPGFQKFVSFQEVPVTKSIPELPIIPALNLDLKALSDRNVLPLKFPLTPSFRRVKQKRTLIKRHSAPEPKRGAFPTAVRVNSSRTSNVYLHPEAKRQQQLSSVLKSIDDSLELIEKDDEISELLNCLRRSLFNSNVDAAAAKSLFRSIISCKNDSRGNLRIELCTPTEMANTQHSFCQSRIELNVVVELIRCVPSFLASLRLAHFQISPDKLIEVAYSLNACQGVTTLSLQTCSLDDSFIEIFVKGLMKRNSLVELDLSGNFIRNAGLLKLGLFILSGTSKLSHLDLSQNFFTLAAIRSFEKLLLSSNKWNLRLITGSRIDDIATDRALRQLYTNQFKLREKFHSYHLLCSRFSEAMKNMIHLTCESNLACSFWVSPMLQDISPEQTSDSLLPAMSKRGFFLTTGLRLQMEDYIIFNPNFRDKASEHLYGILDGHGGIETARLSSFLLPDRLSEEIKQCEMYSEQESSSRQSSGEGNADEIALSISALRGCFQGMQKFLELNSIPHGSCALLVYQKGNHIYTANAGDSQALLVEFENDSGNVKCSPLATIKHPTDEDEQKRIENANGLVLRGRVDGTIAVSRALGDIEYQPKITYRPLVSHHNIGSPAFQNSTRVLVLASDGLWDVLSYEQVAQHVQNFFKMSKGSITCSWELSKILTGVALKEGSRDNISTIVVTI